MYLREEACLWGLGLAILHKAQLKLCLSSVGGQQLALSGSGSLPARGGCWHTSDEPRTSEVCKVEFSLHKPRHSGLVFERQICFCMGGC